MIASDIPHVATYLLGKHGLTQQGWVFRWDSSRRRAGCCRYAQRVITLSRHFVEMNVADRLDEVIDTILHEIAHALAPGDGHGSKWKDACALVGARPERCYDSATVAMPRGRYVATCWGCGKQWSLHRQPKVRRYCLKCGPVVGVLTFRRQDQVVNTSAPPLGSSPDVPPSPKKLRG